MASVLGFTVMYYTMTVLWSLTTALRLLWEIIKHPIACFKKTERTVPPDCLRDVSLGTHEYVTANGIRFHYVTAGDRSKPLMLCVHGFPEFWYSWRHQLREFANDYHVVAIDMRGYGESERPASSADYTFDILRQDIVQLIAALGYESCTLVAHDWGGIVTWRVVQRHPELVDKFIVMNCPHPKVYMKHISTHWSQVMKSWYMFMFQVPGLAEAVLRLHDYKYIDILLYGKHGGVKNRAAFTPEDLEAYKYTFSQPGAMKGPLSYYRCMFQRSNRENRGTFKPIEVPTLLIWGDSDEFIEKEMADNHSPVCTNITVKHIPNCSHWVQQDAPDVCNQYMRDFLAPQ